MSLQLAPEIEAKVREEAAARGVSIDIMLDEAIRLYRKHQDGPIVRRVANFRDRSREPEWAAKPDLKYVNQWVVLEGSEVVLHGPDSKTVYEGARARGISSPFMYFVNETEAAPLFIGWRGVK